MRLQHNTFARRMMQWYRIFARDLPWRNTQEPYRIWISEVMLQQTTVRAVVPYYLRWVKEFPTIWHVADSSLQKILKFWQGLGYYSRARNIHAAAKIICEKYLGIFPDEKTALCCLPGMGPYTTGAVLSIAFDQREPIIDANIRRVVMRQLKVVGKACLANDQKIREFLLEVMPRKNNRIFNQSLMELGALICKSKNPACLCCPVKKFCLAYAAGVVDIIPEPKKQIIKNVSVAVAVIQNSNKYFLQKRPAKGLFADLWEFPGGKIEDGEKPYEAVLREIKEELNITVAIDKKLPNVIQFYTKFKATLYVYLCHPLTMPKVDLRHHWVSLKDIQKYPLPSGTAKIVELLKK